MSTTQTEFGRKVREQLDGKLMSVSALARLMNPKQPEVARRNLLRWIGGYNEPSRINRIAVARALGLADEALFDVEEAAPSGDNFRGGSGADVRDADAGGGAAGVREGAGSAPERDAA